MFGCSFQYFLTIIVVALAGSRRSQAPASNSPQPSHICCAMVWISDRQLPRWQAITASCQKYPPWPNKCSNCIFVRHLNTLTSRKDDSCFRVQLCTMVVYTCTTFLSSTKTVRSLFIIYFFVFLFLLLTRQVPLWEMKVRNCQWANFGLYPR